MNCVVEPTEELGGIYLGNIEAASDPDYLREHKVGAVLTVAARTGISYPETAINFHEVILADDIEHFDLSRHFDRCLDFIERHRKYTNVFVHCFAGISRSATIVIA